MIDAVINELENFEMRISDDGRDHFGAFKTGAHDDLLCALGIAAWC